LDDEILCFWFTFIRTPDNSLQRLTKRRQRNELGARTFGATRAGFATNFEWDGEFRLFVM